MPSFFCSVEAYTAQRDTIWSLIRDKEEKRRVNHKFFWKCLPLSLKARGNIAPKRWSQLYGHMWHSQSRAFWGVNSDPKIQGQRPEDLNRKVHLSPSTPQNHGGEWNINPLILNSNTPRRKVVSFTPPPALTPGKSCGSH